MSFFNSEEEIIQGITGKVVEDMGQVRQFLIKDNDDKGLSNEGLRLDLIENSFRINQKVYFVEKLPLELIGKSRQGATEEGLLNLVNSLLSHFGLQGISSLSQFNKSVFSEKLLSEIKNHLPPVIIILLPDETIQLQDGNHRVVLAQQIFGLKYIRAFISR